MMLFIHQCVLNGFAGKTINRLIIFLMITMRWRCFIFLCCALMLNPLFLMIRLLHLSNEYLLERYSLEFTFCLNLSIQFQANVFTYISVKKDVILPQMIQYLTYLSIFDVLLGNFIDKVNTSAINFCDLHYSENICEMFCQMIINIDVNATNQWKMDNVYHLQMTNY